MVEDAKTGLKGRQVEPATGELALIQYIRERAAKNLAVRGSSTKLGIGDDCAILSVRAAEDLVVTTDLSLEGRHFRREWHSAESIGHRTLARGLSDVAAMGARPIAAFLSLALPRTVARDARWVKGFLDGLLGLAKLHGVPLAGGDTSEAPSDQVIADIMVLGAAPKGRALRRSTAGVGDILYCTGALGGAEAELGQLAAEPGRFRRAKAGGAHPHLFPDVRLGAGQILLRRRLATACIDMSDGLSTDLAHLCEASGVAAEIETSALPLHLLTQKLEPTARMHAALHGGEDYELLFTAKAETRMPKKIGGVAITAVGRIVARTRKAQVVLVDAEGRRTPLEPRGWEHFRG